MNIADLGIAIGKKEPAAAGMDHLNDAIRYLGRGATAPTSADRKDAFWAAMESAEKAALITKMLAEAHLQQWRAEA